MPRCFDDIFPSAEMHHEPVLQSSLSGGCFHNATSFGEIDSQQLHTHPNGTCRLTTKADGGFLCGVGTACTNSKAGHVDGNRDHADFLSSSFAEYPVLPCKYPVLGEALQHPPEKLSEVYKQCWAAPTLNGSEKTQGEELTQFTDLIDLIRPNTEIMVGPDGNAVFGTQGWLWTMHGHTTIYDPHGNPFAMTAQPWFRLRSTVDILSYKPLCPDQKPYDTDGSHPLYHFASVSRRPWPPLWPRWDLQRVKCDGTLSDPILEVAQRYWLSFFRHSDVLNPRSHEVIGTIDHPSAWSGVLSPWATWNVWLAKGMDRLLSLAAIAGISQVEASGAAAVSMNCNGGSTDSGGGG